MRYVFHTVELFSPRRLIHITCPAPMFLDVLAGYNACVFAYGQTSAGKTFTMLGPEGGQDFAGAKAKWGILPRAAELLFGELGGQLTQPMLHNSMSILISFFRYRKARIQRIHVF